MFELDKKLNISPKGDLMWVSIYKPKTGFEESTDLKDLIYDTKLYVSKKDIQKIVKSYNETLDECFGKDAEHKTIKDFEDNDGNYVMYFKNNAYHRETLEQIKIPVYDSKRNPIPLDNGIGIANESKGKVAFNAYPWKRKRKGGGFDTGVSFYLKAIQVIDLVPYTFGEGVSNAFDEEDGYVEEASNSGTTRKANVSKSSEEDTNELDDEIPF